MLKSKDQEIGSRFLKGQDVEAVTGKSLGRALPMVWSQVTGVWVGTGK